VQRRAKNSFCFFALLALFASAFGANAIRRASGRAAVSPVSRLPMRSALTASQQEFNNHAATSGNNENRQDLQDLQD